jgi:S-adenosylmethionine synthetase
MKKLFTSESVTSGHPDKVCDLISDSILDEILSKDKNARVACETFCTTNSVTVMGEISCNCDVDIESVVRKTIKEIGYDNDEYKFNADTCDVRIMLDKQSPDIAMGVDSSYEKKSGETDDEFTNGAGDQGLMFGYACKETPTLMPMAIYYAHLLAKKLENARKSGQISYLRPDGKTQVTVEYDGDTPKRIDAIVVSTQHDEDVSLEQIKKDIKEKIIAPVIPEELLDDDTKYYINPTGRFVYGGPAADTGLTGRKIIVDTYGGYAKHGGGAFSGKDPTKVDRSAAYATRWIAKNIVASGIADKCEIQIAYAIGVANPVSVMVDTFGTAKNNLTDEKIAEIINKVFDLRPSAIIKRLNLKNPIYKNLASFGHMGREDLNVPWEKCDMVAKILEALN